MNRNIKTSLRKISQNKHITLITLLYSYRCLRHYIKLTIESPITKDTNLHSHRHSFHPKPRIEWLPVLTKTTSFPRAFFQPLLFSRKHPSFSVHRVVLMTKTDHDLTFPTFSLRLTVLLSL